MEQATTPPTILIIDDNPGTLFTLQQTLELAGGFTVFTAVNGEEGLHRFYEVRPDCVVIDVRMPGLDGFQFLRAIRGDPETAATPVVVLTAMAMERDRYVGMASGADLYLTKPYRPAEFVRTLREAITTSEESRERRLRELADQQQG